VESNFACTYAIGYAAKSETKRNSIPFSLRLRGINFDILAQDQHIKPSLLQLMEQILEKLLLANKKGLYMILNSHSAEYESNILFLIP